MKHDLSSPLGLLLSDLVYAQEGQRIDSMASEAGVRVRSYPLAQARKEPQKIHAAFFSRDLYEGSSLRKPGPLSDAFFSVVDAAPELRWLHVCSSGLDLPQYAASQRRGVLVTSSKGTTAAPIAQTAVAAILAHSRGFDSWLPAQSRKQWAPLSGQDKPREIHKQHVLVVGVGAIGCEIGRLLKAVGFQTTAVRRTAIPTPPFDETIAFAQLDSALPHCDWLVLAVPLTPQTHCLIDKRRLALLQPHARIANIARGELIDEAALAAALVSGRLAGAAIDVYTQEPLPAGSVFAGVPNLILTPHIAGVTEESNVRVSFFIAQRIAECINKVHNQEK